MIGINIMALAVALSKVSQLGTSPITSNNSKAFSLTFRKSQTVVRFIHGVHGFNPFVSIIETLFGNTRRDTSCNSIHSSLCVNDYI